MRRNQGERGQVVIMLLVAMGIFIFGAIGLAIDGAHLYAQRQLAQAAADAAAQAAIMSIFDHTYNGGKATDFPAAPLTSFTCAIGATSTPCVYAQRNGFGTANDTVVIDFPDSSVAPPGITLTFPDPVNLARATVTRTVDTTLMRLLGPTSSSVRAVGIAAITEVVAPVPILVTHPSYPESLKIQGTPNITVCGGPDQSIQVNSSSETAYSHVGNAQIDLSHAGPADLAGDCSSGTGANFGTFGGPASAIITGTVEAVDLGTTGEYRQPHSPIEDPLKDIPAPNRPTNPGTTSPLANGVSGCPAAPPKACTLYTPGYYPAGITVKNETAVFAPGIYYLDSGGFSNEANGLMLMGTGFPDANFDGHYTGQGMLVYNVGMDASVFDVGSNSNAGTAAMPLQGPPDLSYYKGILFWQNRAAPAPSLPKVHRFGGGGSVYVRGTIYITNTRQIMDATPAQYQTVLLQGTPGSSTTIRGMIIVSVLQLGGNGAITMQISPLDLYTIRQVALIK